MILTAVLVFTAVLACNGDVALAENATLIHPDENYIQSKSVDLIGANENFVATFDKTAKVLTVSGDKRLSLQIDEVVKNVFVLRDKVLLDCADGLKYVSLTSSAPALESADGLSAYTYITVYGDKIYTHVVGRVSVYDSSFNLLSDCVDTVFNNLPVFVTDGETIYSFVAETGLNKVYTYDVSSADSSKRNNGYFVESAAMGKIIYVFNGTNVLLVSPDAIDNPVETSLTVGNFSAVNDELYVANGEKGYSVYVLNDEQNALSLKATYAMSGDGIDKLNAPSDLVVNGGKIYIADKNNNRIVVKNGDEISTVSVPSPEKIATNGNEIFLAGANKISILRANGKTTEYSFEIKIIDLVEDENLFVLTESGISVFMGGRLYDYLAIENGIAITSDGNGNLYVLTDRSVVALSGKNENSLLSFSLEEGLNAVDFVVDYAGNVFVLYDDGKVCKYSWQSVVESNLTDAALESSILTIDGNGYSFTANAIALANDKLLFTTEENAVVSIPAQIVTADNYAPIYADITDYTAIEIRATGDNAYVTSDLNSAHSVRKFNASLVVAYKTADDKYIVEENGVYYFLFGSTEAVATPVEENDYLTNKDAKAYLTPDGKGEITIANGTVVNLVDDACNLDDGKWWRMEKDGVLYFIAREDVSKYVAPTPPEPEKPKAVYGRAKADRAGGVVNLYSSASDNSTIVVSVTDGVKLEVLETLDGYYFVKYGDNLGYVKSDELELEGLTTVQIIAIVLSVVVVVAGALIFVVTYRTKRKIEEQESQKK